MLLEVKVKRKTGFMGSAMRVSLLVDGELVKKLENSEEHLIQTDKNSIKLRAKQGFSGSQEFEVRQNATIEIKTNPIFFWIWLVGLVLLFLATINETRELKFIFATVAIVTMVFNLFYLTKSSFIFKAKTGNQST